MEQFRVLLVMPFQIDFSVVWGRGPIERIIRTLAFGGLGIWTVGFLFIFVLLFSQTAIAQSPSNFALAKLPRGIELQIPKGWRLLGTDMNRLLQSSVEAAMDLSGLGLPEGKEINLISANSMPRSTYASVRVDSTMPPSVALSTFDSVTAADIHELETEVHTRLQKLLPLQGNKLIEFYGSKVEKIAGHPAVVTEYRRTGPKGSVFVQINQIFTSSQEIRIILSYRESEVALWKVVVGKIRKSIIVRSWP